MEVMGIKLRACRFHVIFQDVSGGVQTWGGFVTILSFHFYWLVRLGTSNCNFLGKLRHI